MIQPVLIAILVNYLNGGSYTRTVALVCSCAITVLAFCSSIPLSQTYFYTDKVGLQLRASVSGLVYRKVSL